MNNTTQPTLPCVCGRRPTIDYQRGVMLWRPGCPTPSCTIHGHQFPCFSSEAGAVAAWNMHIRQVKRQLRRKRHGGILL